MEWPSQRIAQGGIFQPAKVNYSPETRNFLKVLLDESKLTMMQRQKVNYSLRSGDPLPTMNSRSSMRGRKKIPAVIIRPGSPKIRSLSAIISSGAYEREQFVPHYPKLDREKAKKHLQDHMAYGKNIVPTPRKPKPKPKEEELNELQENRFDQLLREINDRKKWLDRMTELGEGTKHKTVIQQQIQEKLRQMRRLKAQRQES